MIGAKYTPISKDSNIATSSHSVEGSMFGTHEVVHVALSTDEATEDWGGGRSGGWCIVLVSALVGFRFGSGSVVLASVVLALALAFVVIICRASVVGVGSDAGVGCTIPSVNNTT